MNKLKKIPKINFNKNSGTHKIKDYRVFRFKFASTQNKKNRFIKKFLNKMSCPKIKKV